MAENTGFWGRVKAFRNKHPFWWGLIMMFIVACALVWLVLMFLDVWTHHNDDSVVPEINGMSYSDARGALAKADLDISINDSIYDTSVAPGTVMESWPKAGSVVKRGRSVYVTVTAFSPKTVTLTGPVTGVSVRQAVSYLNALGITAIRLVEVPSEYPDLVESAHANGRPLGIGSVIPVNAKVVLEVGVYHQPEPEPEAVDSIPAEEVIADEITDYSSYDLEE